MGAVERRDMKIGVEQVGLNSHTPTAGTGAAVRFNIIKSGGVKWCAGYLNFTQSIAAQSVVAKITDSDFCPQEAGYISVTKTSGSTNATGLLIVFPNGDITTGPSTFESGSWGMTGVWI